MNISQLEVTLFGDCGFTINGQRISGFPSTKVLALGYYLAATGRPHRRESLATLLWPDYDSARAKKNLRAAIYHLRSQLDAYLTVSRQDVGFVNDGSVTVDSRQFEAAMEQAPHLSEGDAKVDAILAAAVDHYHGGFLQGFFTDDAEPFNEWLSIERERHHQMATQAYSTLVQLAIRRNDALLGIKYATQLLALEPTHEEGYRSLMLLLAQDNRPSAALAQFERCEQILWDELGVEPHDETVKLADRIREGELSGLRFALPTQPSRALHNLPAELTTFVGRRHEVELLTRALIDQKTRLVTITGGGGVGKSRLAIHAASQLVDRLEADEVSESKSEGRDLSLDAVADGIYFVRLAGIEPGRNAELHINAAIAEALQVDIASGDDLRTRLVQVLVGRRMLLILDNFEQIQQHADLLVALLRQASALQLLVTSRIRLNVRGEQVIALDGLPVPGDNDITAVDSSAAIQLFSSAAASVSPTFAQDDADLLAIARACRLVQGLPLGIELAASWTRLLTCEEIALEIERNLDFLNSNMPDLPERHRSLRAVFEHTWRLLSDDERHSLRRLAFFRDGFTRDAADAVAGASLALLLSLVENSLIRRNEMHEDRPTRYEMPELIRQYAAEQLASSDEAEQIAAASAHFYRDLLADLSGELRSGDQVSALDEIAYEIENIRVVHRWSVAHVSAEPKVALALFDACTGALFDFLDIRGWFQEGIFLFGEAADAVASLPSCRDYALIHAKLLARHAWFIFHVGRHEESIRIFLDSIGMSETIDDASERMFMHNYLGAVLRHIGDYTGARHHLELAESIQRDHEDIYQAGVTANVAAQVAFAIGDLETARSQCERALHYKHLCNDRRGRIYSLDYLGRVYKMQGELDLARRSFAESLDIAEEIGDPRAIATAQQNLGAVAFASGQLTGARRQYEIALETFRRIGSQIECSVSLTYLGQIAVAQDRFSEAIDAFREALQIASNIRSAPALIAALLGMVELLLAAERPTLASEILDILLVYPDLEPEQQTKTRELAELAGYAEPRTAGTRADFDAVQALARKMAIRLTSLTREF